MSTSLPERPDLDQLRRQAKELRDAARRGDPDAVERFARHYRRAAHGSRHPGRRPAGHRPGAGLRQLAAAQGGGRGPRHHSRAAGRGLRGGVGRRAVGARPP